MPGVKKVFLPKNQNITRSITYEIEQLNRYETLLAFEKMKGRSFLSYPFLNGIVYLSVFCRVWQGKR